jgi:hypothetical protein
MPKIMSVITMLALIAGCTPATVVSGSERDVTINLDGGLGSPADADAEAQKHCDIFGKQAERTGTNLKNDADLPVLVMTQFYYNCV